MSLKSSTLAAVKQAQKAFGDLAIPLILRQRTQNAYTPGAPVSYTNTDSDASGVITKYKYNEIDGTMIKVEDALIVLFPTTGVVPKQNDIILNGIFEYRVISNQPVFAGDTVAFNLLQGRPI